MCHDRARTLNLFKRLTGKSLADVFIEGKSPVTIDYSKIGFFALGSWNEGRSAFDVLENIDGKK